MACLAGVNAMVGLVLMLLMKMNDAADAMVERSEEEKVPTWKLN